MRTLAAALFSAAALAWPQSGARAGAWTLPQGQVQIITSTFVSRVSRSFDAAGRPDQSTAVDKTFTGIDAEYGLIQGVTLILAPQFVRATNGQSAGQESETDTTVEAGARIRLFRGLGVLSIQGTYETAGAFGDTAADPFSRSGSQMDLRLLYGWNYRLFGRPGFMDVESGYCWNAGARPNEIRADATVGLWVIGGLEAFAQSFTILSTGAGRWDYGRYLNHKVEVSLVGRLTQRTSLQLGVFVSPDGRNTWEEQGLMMGLWYRF